MDKNQLEQIENIETKLNDLVENHPELSVFVNLVIRDFKEEYFHIDQNTEDEY